MTIPFLTPRALFLTEFTTAAMMTGVIWFVQAVHYPLFAKIPSQAFPSYEDLHTVRTAWVVAPLMLMELVSAAALVLLRFPTGETTPIGLSPLHLAALACLLGIWASTFFLQVPLHGKLLLSADPGSLEKLVATNWIRTVLWSLRVILLLPLLPKAVSGLNHG